jgi:uncharacterized membrane protein
MRELQEPTTKHLADRAQVTKNSRELSNEAPAPQLDSLMAVLIALGIVGTVVENTNPWNSTAGRALTTTRSSRSVQRPGHCDLAQRATPE